jgi:N-formylglutamate amidohydrolase
MPSNPIADQVGGRPDFVLGDRFGTSCSSELTRLAGAQLKALGYLVALNKPYAGGYITEHYGRPHKGQHALQIEVNRALYMDETSFEKSSSFARLREDLETVVRALMAGVFGLAIPRAAAE